MFENMLAQHWETDSLVVQWMPMLKILTPLFEGTNSLFRINPYSSEE